MASTKNDLLRSLSTSHFRAIGRVAAQWNALELTILWAIGKESGLNMKTAAILAGSQNATAWCEMLKKLSGDTKTVTRKKTALDTICARVTIAQKQRNDVVHAAWHPREEIRGGLFGELPAQKPKAKDKILGTGVPKRGTSSFTVIEYDSTQMLAVAAEIESIEQALFDWLDPRMTRRRLENAPPPPPGSPHQTNKLLALLQQKQPSPATQEGGLLPVITK